MKERVGLFCFLLAEDLRNKWLANMNRNDLRELSHRQLLDRGYRVCELHFNNSQFKNDLEQRLNVGQILRLVRIQDAPDALRIEPARIKPTEIEPTRIDITGEHGDAENIPPRPIHKNFNVNFNKNSTVPNICACFKKIRTIEEKTL